MRGGNRVQMGLTYAASLLSFAVDGAPRPFSAAFNVTDRCNLRCEYCNFSSFAGPELDVPHIAVLFDRLHGMGVRRLGVVGGEPLVRKDIGEILRLARRRGFFISVSTNLTLYHRFAGVLDPADLIFTSLDGDRATHERSRGEGSHDGVIEAIRALAAAGKSIVGICVARRGDVEQARALIEQARALRIRMHFQPQCLDTKISRGSLPKDATPETLRKFWLELVRMKEAGLPIASSIDYLRAQASWPDFRVSAVRDASTRCAAGRGFLFVDPLGNASPCTYTRGSTPSVNLLSEDWKRDWNRETNCTRCNVGPMLEFNLLYKHPIRAVVNAVRAYG
jgi:MoaA/NifB/PqqE/SkfB family radical SAM enzyme